MKEKPLSRREFLKASSLAMVLLLNPKENLQTVGVISRLETDLPIYALTIDDCWVADSLVGVLNFLKEKRLQATFFPAGQGALVCNYHYPGIFTRMAQEGHTIGYHSMRHPPKQEVLSADRKYWNHDYEEWIDTFRWILGREHFNLAVRAYARAPYGEFTPSFLRLCQGRGLRPFFWSAGSSWLRLDIPLERGDVVILHATEEDLELMREKLDGVSAGLRGTSISCFEDENYCAYFHTREGVLRRRKNARNYLESE